MMRFRRNFWIGLICILLAGLARAQDAGEFMKNAPEFSQWNISYSYADESKAGAGATAAPDPAAAGLRTRRALVTKTGQVIREQLVNTAGDKQDHWFLGSMEYRKENEKSGWFESHKDAHDLAYTPLPESGFRELGWISARTYAGQVTYRGRPCLVFLTVSGINLGDPLISQDGFAALNEVAFIDAATRLPFEVRSHGVTRIFTFSSSPPTSQELPADLVADLKSTNEARARLEQRAGSPY